MTTDKPKNDCCSSDSETAQVKDPCPACGVRGKSVKWITLEALVIPSALERTTTHDGFRFCATRDCDVAYYQLETNEQFLRAEVRVRIGQKESSAPRPVCYCFSHTIEDIEADVAATGDSTIPDSITAKCKQGLDRCEVENPQGTCCLGNVRAALRAAQASPARESAGGDR